MKTSYISRFAAILMPLALSFQTNGQGLTPQEESTNTVWQLDSIHTFHVSQNEEEILIQRQLYTYDANHRIKQKTELNYTPSTEEISNGKQTDYFYEEELEAFELISKRISKNTYIPGQRIDYQYHDKKQILTSLYEWLEEEKIWLIREKFDNFQYDNRDQLVEYERFSWDKAEDDWMPKQQFVLTEKPEKKIWMEYLDLDGTWQEKERRSYVMEENHTKEVLTERWERDQWVNISRLVYANDNHNPTLIEHYEWSADLNDWQLIKKEYRYYTGIETGLEDQKDQPIISCFPNPVTDHLVISSKQMIQGTISIYNNLGQIVLHQQIKDSKKELHLNGLTPGKYIVVIRSPKNQSTFHIIKL